MTSARMSSDVVRSTNAASSEHAPDNDGSLFECLQPLRGSSTTTLGKRARIQRARALADQRARLLEAIQAMEDVEVAGERRQVHRSGHFIAAQAIRRTGAIVAFEQMP